MPPQPTKPHISPELERSLAVIGMGYVGLPLAILAARKGYKVIGVDVSAEKIEQLKRKEAPFKDSQIEEDLKNVTIEFTTDPAAIQRAGTVIVCVPTPVHEDHTPDYTPVEKASEAIGKNMIKGQLIILESTVNPGTTENIMQPLLEKCSGQKAGTDFDLSHCPERINPGDKKWNVENIARVVGSLTPSGLERTAKFYRSILTGEIKPMVSLKETEAVKIVENAFRDINIAFVNELARSFSQIGLDVTRVLEGAGTKPFWFMGHYPSCGVGGHCIPVDPYYMIEDAKKRGFHHDFLALARRINNDMPRFTVQLVADALNERRLPIKRSKVVVLGLSYKRDIDDTRESPSYQIIKHLHEHGAVVETYDPHVLKQSTAQSLEAALENADAVVVATDHAEFKNLKPHTLANKGIWILVDGKNCLPKDDFVKAGITYRGIGR